jgi:hypothetical protein
MNRHARINREKGLTMSNETATTSETAEQTASKTKRPTRKAKTAKAAAKATAKTKKSKTAKRKSKPAGDTKKAIVLALLRRKEGATTAEIAKATDWQNHTIRGFISGTLGKKMGLEVQSAKNDSDERTYRITA